MKKVQNKKKSNQDSSKNEFQASLQAALKELEDAKAQEVKVIKLKGQVSFTDYFILANGTSDRHVQALADKVHLKLKNDFSLLPISFEGFEEGQWVLLDYGDFVFHFFQPETRAYYDLDTFWSHPPEKK